MADQEQLRLTSTTRTTTTCAIHVVTMYPRAMLENHAEGRQKVIKIKLLAIIQWEETLKIRSCKN